MIWQAWAILVLVGSGAAYLAFVPKKAPVFTSLATIGTFSVAAIGSLDLVDASSTSPYHATETGAAILFGLGAVVASIVFLAALTGQYGDTDDEDDPTGGVAKPDDGSGGFLDGIVRRMT